MQEVLRCFLMIVYKQRAITLTSASSIEVTSHPNFNSKDFMKLSQCSLVYMPSVAVLTHKKNYYQKTDIFNQLLYRFNNFTTSELGKFNDFFFSMLVLYLSSI